MVSQDEAWHVVALFQGRDNRFRIERSWLSAALGWASLLVPSLAQHTPPARPPRVGNLCDVPKLCHS